MIPLFVNSVLVEFSLESFHVDHVYFVARKYCEDNAASFGVTPDDLENSCTIIVFNNLFAKINDKKTALAQAQQPPQTTSPELKATRSSHDPTADSPIDDNSGRPTTMASYPVSCYIMYFSYIIIESILDSSIHSIIDSIIRH